VVAAVITVAAVLADYYLVAQFQYHQVQVTQLLSEQVGLAILQKEQTQPHLG
jgi:hypothetical protein